MYAAKSWDVFKASFFHNSDANKNNKNRLWIFIYASKIVQVLLCFHSLKCIHQMTCRGFSDLHHVQFQFYLNPC